MSVAPTTYRSGPVDPLVKRCPDGTYLPFWVSGGMVLSIKSRRADADGGCKLPPDHSREGHVAGDCLAQSRGEVSPRQSFDRIIGCASLQCTHDMAARGERGHSHEASARITFDDHPNRLDAETCGIWRSMTVTSGRNSR